MTVSGVGVPATQGFSFGSGSWFRMMSATLGNTAGGMTTYLIGRLVPQKADFHPRALAWLKRYGAG